MNKIAFFSAFISFWILIVCLILVLFQNMESQNELTLQLRVNQMAVEENTEAYYAMIMMLGNCQI